MARPAITPGRQGFRDPFQVDRQFAFWGRKRSRVPGGETSQQEGPDRARSAPLACGRRDLAPAAGRATRGPRGPRSSRGVGGPGLGSGRSRTRSGGWTAATDGLRRWPRSAPAEPLPGVPWPGGVRRKATARVGPALSTRRGFPSLQAKHRPGGCPANWTA
jgi:hypothetical protein